MKPSHSVESRLFEHTSVALLAVASSVAALPIAVEHNFAGLWLGIEYEEPEIQTSLLVGFLLVEALRLGSGQNKVQPVQGAEGPHPFELQQWKGLVDRLLPEAELVIEEGLESILLRSTSIAHQG